MRSEPRVRSQAKTFWRSARVRITETTTRCRSASHRTWGLAGDAEAPTAVLTTRGMSPKSTDEIVIMPYNDLAAAERIIRDNADDLAAVIVEPINGQWRYGACRYRIPRRLATRHSELGMLLIFDEVDCVPSVRRRCTRTLRCHARFDLFRQGDRRRIAGRRRLVVETTLCRFGTRAVLADRKCHTLARSTAIQ